MRELRQAPRLRTYKGGRINATRLPGLDCIIRNLSDAGACLLVDGSKVPIDEFDLVILPEYLKRRCKVIWRQPDKLGVRFLKGGSLSAMLATRR